MKKTIMAMAALAFVGAVTAIEVVPTNTNISNCKTVGTVQAGDLFSRLDRETAIAAVKEEASALQADKVSLDVTYFNHSKLGKQYIAKGNALKCN